MTAENKLTNLAVVENQIAASAVELAVLDSQLSGGKTELETINAGITKKTIRLFH